MSATRGNANQSLYLARILLDGWGGAVTQQSVAQPVLTQAYLPAVREHLINAYGWFLLETAGHEDWNDVLPRAVADLPAVPNGKATSGEVREFEALESDGWLCSLLAELDFSRPVVSPRSRARNNLAVAATAGASREDAENWHMHLSDVISRMRDSFDEY